MSEYGAADAQEVRSPGVRLGEAAAKQRIRATLRSSLNRAIKQDGLITVNPAAFVELESGKCPKVIGRRTRGQDDPACVPHGHRD